MRASWRTSRMTSSPTRWMRSGCRTALCPLRRTRAGMSSASPWRVRIAGRSISGTTSTSWTPRTRKEGEPDESNVHLIADSFDEFLALLSDEDAPHQPPKSPIRQLIEADDLDGLRRLLDEGYDVEFKDDAWGTAAEVAALLNKPE